jgi:hypothetical protein
MLQLRCFVDRFGALTFNSVSVPRTPKKQV